jgi:hypothetical protein
MLAKSRSQNNAAQKPPGLEPQAFERKMERALAVMASNSL